MSDPKTLEEFNARFAENSYITGTGLEAEVHLPCPFCAAENFIVFHMLDAEAVAKLESFCMECDRGVILEIKPLKRGGVSWQFKQTRGDDPPAYLPVIERVQTPKGGDA